MEKEQILNPESLVQALKNQGFSHVAPLPMSPLGQRIIMESEMPAESSIIMCFFPFFCRDKASLISDFARSNHYREIVHFMGQALKEAGSPFSEWQRREIRFFSNSRFPEKKMAFLSGLGFMGRNTLLINPVHGSKGLLGGMILPVEWEWGQECSRAAMADCGNCRVCESSCPGGALKDYHLDEKRCLQYWTTSNDIIPDNLKDKWGMRIYGCSICQDVCPHNQGIPERSITKRGLVDPEPGLDWYLGEDGSAIKDYFRGSSLSMSWITAEQLQRNAILSAGWSKKRDFEALLKGFGHSGSAIIKEAAIWALLQIGSDRE